MDVSIKNELKANNGCISDDGGGHRVSTKMKRLAVSLVALSLRSGINKERIERHPMFIIFIMILRCTK